MDEEQIVSEIRDIKHCCYFFVVVILLRFLLDLMAAGWLELLYY